MHEISFSLNILSNIFFSFMFSWSWPFTLGRGNLNWNFPSRHRYWTLWVNLLPFALLLKSLEFTHLIVISVSKPGLDISTICISAENCFRYCQLFFTFIWDSGLFFYYVKNVTRILMWVVLSFHINFHTIDISILWILISISTRDIPIF